MEPMLENITISMAEEDSSKSSDTLNPYDSQDECPAIRLTPLGSSEICDANYSFYEYGSDYEADRLQKLEAEQEQLNSSLFALTTHFAQVQFRLKQIVDADTEQKEVLLKDLEEFAFRGIPDVFDYNTDDVEPNISVTERDREVKLEEQRVKQKELINQLKEQLEDLEKYAYETGEAGMPQSMILERHSVIVEQLKGKLALDLDELDKMSPEELRAQVDQAIRKVCNLISKPTLLKCNLVNPVKMKEQLVCQLKTQITDLERFIEFLQGEVSNKGQPHCTCNCPVHGKVSDSLKNRGKICNSGQTIGAQQPYGDEPLNKSSVKIIRRAVALLQMFALTQFGCGTSAFEKNVLKKTDKANHWGDLRANLEIAINNIEQLVANSEPVGIDSDYTSDSEDAPIIQCNEKLTTAVRKDLSTAIRDLMQHGLMPIGQSNSLVPFGCFPVRSSNTTKMMHVWDLMVKYYEFKNGRMYNASPARKLSQSFNLEIVGGAAVTSKQTLLGALDNIMSTHTPLKRSADSHFKAFICAALNQKKLVSWLRLITRCKPLTDKFYQPWSYTIRTGFEDAFKSLDRLNQLDFDLPVDLAVRQLQNIKDAF